LDPLAASRPQVELYVRWMQEVRRLKQSTTSRRMSIVAGFYRTAVVDGLLEHSRPSMCAGRTCQRSHRRPA
jgi:integrase/recombinase XerD